MDLRGGRDRAGEMGHDANIVRLAEGTDADQLGDAAGVRERDANEVEVVVLDQREKIPAGAQFFAGGEGEDRHAAQLGNVLDKRVGLHRILDR